MNKSLPSIDKLLLASFSVAVFGIGIPGCKQQPSTEVSPAQKRTTEFSESAGVTSLPETTNAASTTENSAEIPATNDAQIVSGAAFSYAILHWNVESGGSDPATVAAQLVELGRYDVVGLSEVDDPAAFEQALEQKWPGRFQFIRGLTGVNEDREDDHLWLAFDAEKFSLVNSEEMTERQVQARTLREWARIKSIPIVAIGDYNLDFEFATQRGNPAFAEMMRDNVWKWSGRNRSLIQTGRTVTAMGSTITLIRFSISVSSPAPPKRGRQAAA